jgi:glucose uptake protein GlcU
MQKNKTKNNNTSKYAILITVFVLIVYLIYVVFSNDSEVNVEEMLKHVNVGEVPF